MDCWTLIALYRVISVGGEGMKLVQIVITGLDAFECWFISSPTRLLKSQKKADIQVSGAPMRLKP